jgi:hypothetical protein
MFALPLLAAVLNTPWGAQLTRESNNLPARLSSMRSSLRLLLVSLAVLSLRAEDEKMPRLAYHHPRLVVDLGVGLWAWPLPMDYDGDGLMDLVMSGPEGCLALYERRRGANGKLELPPPQRVFWSEGASVFNSNGLPQNKESGLLRLNDGTYGRAGRRTFCIADWEGDGTLDFLMNSAPNVSFFRGLGKNSDGQWAFRDQGPMSPQVLAGHATKPTYFAATRELLIGAEDGFIHRLKQPVSRK